MILFFSLLYTAIVVAHNIAYGFAYPFWLFGVMTAIGWASAYYYKRYLA